MSHFTAKMHRIWFRLRLCRRPRWGSSQRSPDSLDGYKRAALKCRPPDFEFRHAHQSWPPIVNNRPYNKTNTECNVQKQYWTGHTNRNCFTEKNELRATYTYKREFVRNKRNELATTLTRNEELLW